MHIQMNLDVCIKSRCIELRVSASVNAYVCV